MKKKLKCFFCNEKKNWTEFTNVGVKEICDDCMQRLIEMIEFHKKQLM